MMSFASKHGFLLACIRALLDIGCIVLAYLATVLCSYFEGMGNREAAWQMWPYLIGYCVVWCLVADQQFFQSRRSESMVSHLFSLVRSYITTFLFVAFLLAIFIPDNFDRLFFLTLSVLALVFLLTFRMTIGLSLSKLRRLGFNTQRIILIGANERAAHLVEIFNANEQYGYHIEGFLEDDPLRHRILERHGIPCLGKVDDLENLLLEKVIDRIYVALPVRSHYEIVQSIAHLCEGIGVPVRFVADFFPLGILTSNMNHLKDIPLLSLTYEPEFQTRFVLQRTADQLSALIVWVFLSPLIGVIALLIKLESGGPVFCRSWSEKPDGGMFQMFRFSVLKAPELPQDVNDIKLGDIPVPGIGIPHYADAPHADAETPKTNMTRIGRWIRQNGLEDLPQLLNVILGQIVLSGPHSWRSLSSVKKTTKDKERSEQLHAETTG